VQHLSFVSFAVVVLSGIAASRLRHNVSITTTVFFLQEALSFQWLASFELAQSITAVSGSKDQLVGI